MFKDFVRNFSQDSFINFSRDSYMGFHQGLEQEFIPGSFTDYFGDCISGSSRSFPGFSPSCIYSVLSSENLSEIPPRDPLLISPGYSLLLFHGFIDSFRNSLKDSSRNF